MANSHTAADDGIVSKLRNSGPSSRRQFLQRSAAAGAAALAVGIGSSNTALAQEAEDDEVSDVDVLNYALTLEHLEYAFYRDGLEQFCHSDFMRADTLSGFGSRVREDVPSNIADVRDHERTHVEKLTAVIEDLGGDPVAEAEYEFGVETVDDFLGVAAVLENTGVSAYDGAIALIDNPDLQTAGATIATVEARHASYLNLVTDADPFPAAFDEAKSMSEVLDAAGGFIEG